MASMITRYSIQKSPLNKKFYIWDSQEKKFATNEGYDIIIEIVSDKYAIVGTAEYYQVGYRYYKTYNYQLIDVNGRLVFDNVFEFVYPCDSFVYCKFKGMPINQLSYLGNYIWNHKHGQHFNREPYYYCDDEKAIIKCDYWHERYESGFIYKQIDTQGNILREEKVRKKDSVEKIFGGTAKYDYSNLVYIDVLAESIDKKWGRINEIAKRTSNNYSNVCDFNLSERYVFNNVSLGFAWGIFLLVYKAEEVPDYNSHSPKSYKKGKCIAILNEDFKVIFYSKEGFDVHPRTFHNRIVINHDYILNEDGSIYNMPTGVIFDEFYSDWNGYAEIKKDNKIGYMNNNGVIVIPPIFPKDEQTGIDEDAANDSWQEYQKYAGESVSDAYE